MIPTLSIIIPYFNHRVSLPRLLESIKQQSLKDIEIVIVDDNSEQECEDIASNFSRQGLCVRLVRNTERLYVKNTRLAGVEAATAPRFMFADADDVLWGDSALEEHVRLQVEHDADVVHFRSILVDGKAEFSGAYSWADPFAPKLAGGNIFRAYARSEMDGGVIWNKIFKRSFWLRIMPELRQLPLKTACEDIFLNILVFFHAQIYVGSDLTGYGFHFCPEKRGEKALMRAVALYKILNSTIPSLRASGGNKDDIQRLEQSLLNFMAVCGGRAGIYAQSRGDALNDLVKEALSQEPCEMLIKTLLGALAVNGSKLQNIQRALL